jgi:putative aldouronate transport system permease protein
MHLVYTKDKKIKKQNGFIKELKTNRVFFLMLVLPFTYVIIQFYLPMAGLVVAFKNFNYVGGIFNSPWCGLSNFKFLFQSQYAWEITRNTLLYNIVFIFLGLVFGVLFAILLSELKNKFMSKVYQSVIFLPYFFSWVVVAYMVYALLEPQNGLINRVFFTSFGLKAPDWYSTASYWPFILTTVNIWKGIGYGTVIYLAGIAGIDDTYYEAATLDGCSKFKQIWYITLPFLKPMMIILTIIALGNIFRSDFGLFFQVPMDSGMLYSTTNTIDTYVYRGLTVTGNIGMSSAAGFYQSCVGFIVVLFSNFILGKISPEDKIF